MGSYPLQPVRIVGHLLNGILRVAPQTNAPKLARPPFGNSGVGNSRRMMNLNAKIGRNEKCWCGSNKKFKRCHLNRETEPRPGIQEVLDRFRKVYRQGKCSHPSAGHKLCKGKTIKARTVQRNGGLNLIASNGHVYTLLQNGKMFDQDRWDLNAGPNKVGIGEASTFAGFCAHHDNELFGPVEKQPFQGTLEQIAILGYRAICHELSLKECSVEVAMGSSSPGIPQVLTARASSRSKTTFFAILRTFFKVSSRVPATFSEATSSRLPPWRMSYDASSTSPWA